MTEVGVGSSAGEDREGITPDLQALLDAMDGVRARDQQLAGTLTRLFTVVAIEAGRSSRFANALSALFESPIARRARRRARRSARATGGSPARSTRSRSTPKVRNLASGLAWRC